MCCFEPAHGLNEEILDLYARSRLTLTRQVRCHPGRNDTVDLLFAVHFAADSDEVHMATQLQREATVFLPFNRGSHPGEVQCGRGNPQHRTRPDTAAAT